MFLPLIESGPGIAAAVALEAEKQQVQAVDHVRRGFVMRIKEVDQMAREVLGYPSASETEDPIEAYAHFVQGDREALVTQMSRVRTLGNKALFRDVWEKIRESERQFCSKDEVSGGRSHYVPPAAYTFASWLVDAFREGGEETTSFVASYKQESQECYVWQNKLPLSPWGKEKSRLSILRLFK